MKLPSLLRPFSLLRLAGVVLVLLLAACSLPAPADIEAGLDEFTRQAKVAMDKDPVIREHIGSIEKITLDEDASGAAPGQNEFVFHVEGSKGKGTVQADFITIDDASEALGKGKLTMADGSTHDIAGEPDAYTHLSD